MNVAIRLETLRRKAPRGAVRRATVLALMALAGQSALTAAAKESTPQDSKPARPASLDSSPSDSKPLDLKMLESMALDSKSLESKPSGSTTQSLQPVFPRRTGELAIATVGRFELPLRQMRHLIKPRLKVMSEERKLDPVKDEKQYNLLKRMIEEDVVAEWLGVTALKHEAETLNLTVTQGEVDAAIAKLNQEVDKAQGKSIVEAAEQAGLSAEDFEEVLRDALLADKFVGHWIEQNITEAQLRQIYDQNPQRFVLKPHRRHIGYLVLMKQNGVDPASQKKALAKARAKAERGADWGDLAKEAGMDSRIPHDRWVTRADRFADANLDRLVWETKVGGISDAIETRYGFHLFKILEDIPDQGTTFEECRPVIIERLIEQYRSQLSKSALEKLKPVTFVNQNYFTPIDEANDAAINDQVMEAIKENRAKRQKPKEEKVFQITPAPR